MLERGAPTPADIKAAVKAVKAMPPAGDDDHVATPFPVYGKQLPAISTDAWKSAKLKTVKLSKLQASNAQVGRDDLIWHVQNPFKAQDPSMDPHPQVVKTKGGDKVIVGGHHRLGALAILKQQKDTAWVLDESDLDDNGDVK